jgi:alpha-galactosidase
MCEWGVAAPWQWAKSVGNSWRTDADIAPSWDSVLRCLDNGAAGLAKFAGPGGWNDPDMLEVSRLDVLRDRS